MRKLKIKLGKSRRIAPGFDEETVVQLETGLKSVVKRDAKQLYKFIGAVNEHFIHYKMWAPSESEMQFDDDRERLMTNIEDTARRFAVAVQSIDQVTLRYLTVEYFMTYRRKHKSEDDLIIRSQYRNAEQDIADILTAGRCAENLAKAIHNILEKKEDDKRDYIKPESVDQHIKMFIRRVANAYAVIYNETPSNKIDGVFFRAIKIILEKAEIKFRLGEKKT